jgi:hypothetical protein
MVLAEFETVDVAGFVQAEICEENQPFTRFSALSSNDWNKAQPADLSPGEQ